VTSKHARDRPEPAAPASEIRAAGAVLYRRAGAGTEVAVIHRPGHADWTFPKGKLEPGEHVLLAAVREVTEETGIRPVLGRSLATVRYLVDGGPKRVDYWAACADDATIGPFTPGAEVDRLEWLSAPAARARLTYAHDQKVLDQLLAPTGDRHTVADTVPCILLRHASAGRKNSWPGDDLLRPLDEPGEADAQALAGLLACFGPRRVISSATERCRATVRPYAEQIGAAIEAEPAFTVGHGPQGGRVQAARARMAELIAQPSPMVICGHRENLPVLLAEALTDLDDHQPTDEWSPPKGGFWVLHIAGGALSALEHHCLTD
jgi:8-oxo-dGTP pyrophosphatase MutT (NUDIX family)/phosphohistidine phosphatase SixA